MKSWITLLVFLFISPMALAKLKVVTTTTDVAALLSAVGGEDIEVTSIAKGTQDPHYLEAKPSFAIKVRDADLLVANGLSLEVGWLPSLIRTARQPRVNPGTTGYLDLGSLITPIEVPTGAITRANGDVHPEGNPHFTLDPVRVAELSVKVAERLGTLDSSHRDAYLKRAQNFREKTLAKVEEWKKRISKSGVKEVITYHPSLNYFNLRFDIKVPMYLEPKAGIPPTPQHILSLIDLMKTEKIRLILVDNFFDTKVADRVAKDVPGAQVASVGIAVESDPKLKTLEDVTEQLVRIIESSGRK